MHKRGFTLIELLVVISIISLLSSIVLASFANVQQKARLAAGRQFEASVNSVAGDQVVTQLDFNDCSGIIARDSSGTGRNATLSTASWSSDTQAGSGCSFLALGTNTVTIPSSSVSFGNSLTVSIWIKQSSYQSRATMVSNSLFAVSGYFIGQGHSSANGLLNFTVNGAGFTSSLPSNRPIPLNEWVNIVGVYDGTRMSLYMNGNLVASQLLANGIINNSSVIGVAGANAQGGWGGYTGLIDNVRIYAKSLVASEVKEQYLAERVHYLASEGLR